MGEPMRAYEAGQELLCHLPSNSNASGILVRAYCPRLRRCVLAGFAGARRHYIALWTSLVADMSLIWDVKTHLLGSGGWAGCAQLLLTGGLRVCMCRHLGLQLLC